MSKPRRLRRAGHIVRMEEGRGGFKILTGKPTGKRPRWVENIRFYLIGIGVNARNWVDSAQDRRDYWRPLVNAY